MPALLRASNDAYLVDANGDAIESSTNTPTQPLVTPNASLTSKARHVVARSSGRDS